MRSTQGSLSSTTQQHCPQDERRENAPEIHLYKQSEKHALISSGKDSLNSTTAAMTKWQNMMRLGILQRGNETQQLFIKGSTIYTVRTDIADTEWRILKKIGLNHDTTFIIDSFHSASIPQHVMKSAEFTLGDIFDFVPWSDKYIQLFACPVSSFEMQSHNPSLTVEDILSLALHSRARHLSPERR